MKRLKKNIQPEGPHHHLDSGRWIPSADAGTPEPQRDQIVWQSSRWRSHLKNACN